MTEIKATAPFRGVVVWRQFSPTESAAAVAGRAASPLGARSTRPPLAAKTEQMAGPRARTCPDAAAAAAAAESSKVELTRPHARVYREPGDKDR